MYSASLLDHYSTLEDPRQHWKVVYPLREVLLHVLRAKMGGAYDFVEVIRWGEQKLTFLKHYSATK